MVNREPPEPATRSHRPWGEGVFTNRALIIRGVHQPTLEQALLETPDQLRVATHATTHIVIIAGT